MSIRDLPTTELPVTDGVRAGVEELVIEPSARLEEDAELTQGDFVGRYSVLSCLGRGGMGMVYKAYDPQLDRNVALKLLRRGSPSVTADLRLLREAQTLAKLKHPNVVAVYDAGLTNHGVFLAMELLSGRTINDWLEHEERSVEDVLAVFRAAGKGLVAAHEAGFVHRDFKPSNVLVEDDGSVRVLDFGLAHMVDEPSGPTPHITSPEARSSRSSRERSTDERSRSGSRSRHEVFATEDGLVIGTPAFMAPEQIVGDRGDHRSEQFAFAMSLYVALYDRSPLAGETYEERRKNIVGGLKVAERDLERSASGERVPPRIRHAILRGLADEPSARFDSMVELLAELEPPSRRWRLGAVVGFTLLAGFGVGAMVFDDPSESPCTDPGAALEDTWGPADRAALGSAFAGHELASSLPRVSARLDGYADAWVEMYESSCRATFVTHQQSERLFDERMRCLERRRNRLRSAVDALVEAETHEVLIERTILPFKLPGLESCADLEALSAEQPLPDDPELRRRIARLRERIDRADTLHDAGEFSPGLSLAREAVRTARDLDHPPVLAEALFSLGRLQVSGASPRDAQATLEEAVLVAAKGGDDHIAAAAWTWLLFSLTMQGRVEEATALELAARVAVERAHDEVVRGWLLNNLGVLHAERGDQERALEHLREALEVKQRGLGPAHVDVAISWFNLGTALLNEGRLEEARGAFEHARSIFEATVGADHPMTHYSMSGSCRVEQAQGHARAAMQLCQEVLSRFEILPPSPRWIASVSFTLAQAQWDAGIPEEARRTAERARTYATNDEGLLQQIDAWLEATSPR